MPGLDSRARPLPSLPAKAFAGRESERGASYFEIIVPIKSWLFAISASSPRPPLRGREGVLRFGPSLSVSTYHSQPFPLAGSWLAGRFLRGQGVRVCMSASAGANAAVRTEEINRNHGRKRSKDAPKQRPAHPLRPKAGIEPPASPEVTRQVANAIIHQRHQSLRASTPARIHPFIEINLAGDKKQRVT